MNNFSKILNFSNLKNNTYRNILIFTVMAGVLSQSLLLPTLDYVTLDLKQGINKFYDYAMISTIAASLPQAISLLIGYFVNNISFKKLLFIGFTLLITFSAILLFTYHIFIIYLLWIIACGVIFNAIFLNISRQICYLLADKIKDYQNDSFLLSTLGNMLGLQLGNLVYNKFHLPGIIIVFIFVLILLFMLIRKTTFNLEIEQSASSFKINGMFKVVKRQPKFMLFLLTMFSIIFIGSGFNMFILSKIHGLNLHNSMYSMLFTIMTAGGFISAIIIKNPSIQKLDNYKTLIFAQIIIILVYLLLSVAVYKSILYLAMFTFGFANVFFLINMNTICFNFLNANKELLKIAPVINGFMMTGFYSVSLIGPLLYNVLLKSGFHLNVLLLFAAAIESVLAVCLYALLVHKK